jgi:RHS repeat-associated protein
MADISRGPLFNYHEARIMSKVDLPVAGRFRTPPASRRTRQWRRTRAALLPRLVELERRVLLSNLPDLIASAAKAPGSAIVGNGKTIELDRTVTNQGGAIAAASSWDDAVYLSPTSTYNASTAFPIDSEEQDVILGLNDGGSYNVDDSVTVPNVPASFALGSDFVLFVTNSDGGLTESNTANDIDALPITLSAPQVDLGISSPTTSLTAAQAGNGQAINLSWTVSNLGSAAAGADRTDAVYLANATTLGAATRSWQIASVDTYDDQPALAGGSNTTEAATGTITNVPAGSYYLVYVVNDQGTSTFGAQSETSTANDSTYLPITITRPSVNLDLETASLSTSSTITEGSLVTVTYTVENIGTAAAAGSWSDSIYLSSTSTVNSNSQLLDTLSPPVSSVPLGAQATYTNQDTVTIPQASIGANYLIVVTNDGDTQAETDDPTDADDSFAIPITLNAPDLTATIISSPSSAIVGASVPVTYTVTNQGSAATVTDWDDAVYLSPTSTFDPTTATLAGTFDTRYSNEHGFSDFAPLAAGASYTRTVNVAIPVTAVGAHYLVVVADDDNLSADEDHLYQPDSDPANNAVSAAITVSAPDLTVTAATAPSSAIEGQSISVSWTAENTGVVAALGDWYDAVFVSSSATLDDTAAFVGSFDEDSQAPLAPNASYTVSQSIALPPTATGDDYLFFVTNIGGLTDYYEYTDYSGSGQGESSYANNTYVAPITLSAPDLELVTATAPSSAIEGASIGVSWTVKNVGSVEAPGDWYDEVYVGSSPTFDADTDTYVAGFDESDQSPLVAGASYTDTESIAIPPSATGDQYLIFVANDNAVEGYDDDNDAQGETNYANNTYALPITLSAPDLTITAASAPSSGGVGQSLSVSWTVQNIGGVAAPGDWYDAVFLGSSPNFDAEDDTLLDSFSEPEQSRLAAASSYVDSESVSLPEDAAIGDEYLIFVTNYDAVEGGYYEEFGQGETNYTNNTYALPITIQAPDLTVTAASAPSSFIEGQSINVSWTVQNIGPVAAQSDWYDAVYVGSSPTFDASTDTYVTSFYESGQSPLAAEASYTGNESIVIAGAATGDEYLIFVTNYEAVEGDSYDYDTQVETNYANNTYAVPVTITAPDLTITTATGPPSAIEGQSVSVSWTVQNIGSVEAPGIWEDAVYIGSSPTFNEDTDTLIDSYYEGGQSPLAAGGSYTANESITIPPAATGDDYLIFVTNYEAVEGADYDAQGETDFTNNTYAVPITLSAPDLTITTASAPSSAIVSGAIGISWTVKNIGSVESPGDWYDAVYIGSSPTFNEDSDTFIDSFYEGGQSPLAAGASYTADESITLPATAAAGDEYLIFVTNYEAVEGETYDAQGETNYSNNTYAVPITVTVPDLTITSASAPSSSALGAAINVSWTVKDIGSVAAPGDWYDAVYIGSSPTFNAETDTFVADFSESGQSPLAAGASYTANESIALPATATTGDEYLIFVTNYYAVEDDFYYDETQGETNYTNNTYAVPITVSAPDLGLVTASAPASGIASGTIDVSWTVQNKNIGSVAAQATWYDAVYIGSSPTFNSYSDTLVASFDESSDSPLAPDGSYSDTNQAITLPATAIGSEYLFFVTNYYGVEGDSYHAQGESNYANNIYSVPITVSAPDLTITSATAPSSANVGATVSVSWTVKNIGSVEAPGDWYDAVYIGSSPTFDADTDTFVASFNESSQSPLAAGASYTDSESITLPATAATGSEFLIFVANYEGVDGDIYYGSAQGEPNYANNTFAIPITVSAPDLTITTATAPASAILGASASVSWTVENIGSIAAQGEWYDAVFIGSSPTFNEYSDTFVGSFNEDSQSPLAADASYTANESITLPATALIGSEYLIFVTNYYAVEDDFYGEALDETGYTNNTYVLPITLSAPDLELVTATAPASAVVDGAINVSWTVKNIGSSAAQGDWYDAVYIGSSPTFNQYDDTLVSDFNESSQSALAPGASYSATNQAITVPGGAPLGDDYLFFVTNYYGVEGDSSHALAESNYVNNIYSVPITVQAPDLTITTATAPSSADEGATVNVSWTVQNTGSVKALGDWYDAVYIGSSSTFDLNSDILIEDFDESVYSPLAAGASYTDSESITIPAAASGSEYIFFVTNNSAVYDYYSGYDFYYADQGETDYANNTFAVPITLSARDLTVTAISEPASGSTFAVNSTIPISWSVENIGTAAAQGVWDDAVFLSPTPTIGDSAVYLTEYAYDGTESPLAAGASYTAAIDVDLGDHLPLGSQYLIIETDANGSAPNTLAIPVTVAAPDFVVSSASVVPTTAEVGNKESVTLTYTVENQGPVAALGQWYDAVYLSSSATVDVTTATPLATYYEDYSTTGLAAGASYTEQEQVTIPNTTPGAEYLVVVTNYVGLGGGDYYYYGNDYIAESNYANNSDAVPITLTAPYVDLAISQPIAPSTAIVDQSIAIGYTVTNLGTETADGDWQDEIYLGSSPTYASSDTSLDYILRGGYVDAPLGPTSSYSFSGYVSVPDVTPGSYYIIFISNFAELQGETDYTNDSTSLPITITAPDLTVTSGSIVGNADGVLVQNNSYTVDWTVQNIGAVAAPGRWYDAVYLSTTPTFNASDSTFLDDFYESSNSPLGPSASYQGSEAISIPSSDVTGSEYLLIITNYYALVAQEYPDLYQGETDYSNNTYSIPVYVSEPAADLTINSATAPATATLGQQIQVSWTVENQGNDPANADWYDAIYLSDDETFNSSAQYITQFNESAHSGLSYQAGSNTYTDTETITIPSAATGPEYLIFYTNADGSQSETNPYNNTYVIPITLSSPYLVATSATAPATATAGATIPISWTVTNEGNGPTTVSDWQDEFFLSSSPTYSYGDTFLGYADINSSDVTLPVPAGGTYTVSENLTLSSGLSGTIYVIIIPNHGYYPYDQPEYGSGNTSYAVPVSIAAPSLAITAESLPTSAEPGQTVPISWTVTNLGNASTVDDWHDKVYLTSTNGATSTLAYVEITSPNTPLAPNASYMISQNVTIPALATGTYTFYIVADDDGGQPEQAPANGTYTQSITIADPDPAVTAVTAPASASPGQTIPISWTVENEGTVPTAYGWTDNVYVSPDQTLDGKAILIASVPISSPNVPLAPGASYTITQNFEIPAVIPGSDYILVVTDANGAQPEVTTLNDLFAKPITVYPPPDLVPQSIAIFSNPAFGEPATISWIDENIGQGPTLSGWTDAVYVSASPTLSASAILLGTVEQSGNAPLAAGAGVDESLTLTFPLSATLPAGTYYVFVQVNSTGSLVESNTTNDVGSVQAAIALSAPDLVVSNIVNPATGETDQLTNVSWTDSNEGNVGIMNGWDDQVYASPDGKLSDSVLLGDFPEDGTLAAGTSASIVQLVALPGTAGTYSIIVVTNANGAINEGPNAGNDTTISTTTIKVIAEPLADLIVSSITPPPDGVFSSQTVAVTYTVDNIGDAPTSAAVWQDVVILSQDPSLTYNGGLGHDDDESLYDQPVLDYFNNPSHLGVGQSYQNTVDVTLPVTAEGPWYVYVLANGLGYIHHPSLTESTRANNLMVSAAFNVKLTPAPALDVSSVVAPSQAFSGQPLTVNWAVTDDGAGPTTATSWTDEVFMSPTPTFDSSTAITLGKFTHDGALTAGGSYSQSQSVTLPVAISGSYYFIVQTDVNGQVFQNGDTLGNIGVESSATNVNLTPPADLTVKAVVPKANSVLAGHTLSVTYTIENAGAGATEMAAGPSATPSWIDAFYLSPTVTLNAATEIAVGTATHTGSLAAGNKYTATATLTLPNAIAGTYYLIADADVADQVYEFDLSSKIGASASTIAVSSAPADLIVSSFKVPASVQAGTNVSLSWTVKNQGTGDSIATSWDDDVFASTSSNLSSPILVGTYVHNGLMNADQSYTTSQPVPIPLSLSGTVYLFVTTNPSFIDPTTKLTTYAVYESNYANDNSTAAIVTVAQALADLIVQNVAAPSTLETGQMVTVTWTTDNDGNATTNASSWYDDVWMSTDADVNEGGNDVYLGSYYRSNSLAAGQSYSASATVTIPYSVAAGSYYVIVRADRPTPIPGETSTSIAATVNRVLESNESNNDTSSTAIPVTAGPAPDLTVTAVTAPTTAVEGQPITVSWTVANSGAGGTTQSWNDAVYLSLDTLYDPLSAIYLGYMTHTGGLAAGNTYNQQGTFEIPAGLSGTYNVLVITNAGDSAYESNYINDIRASAQQTDISLTPPVDLVAGTITIPANAVPGSTMTFSYTVTNQSANPAVGQWTDSLYLSPTTSFVFTDPLLATNVHQGGLPAGQSYTDTITATVPGVVPGTYYVILRTDVLNQIPETTRANNISASLSHVSIDAPALTLGTATDGTLGQGQSAYFKVVVASGQTLQISFNSQEAAALNELFVSYATMPSQSQSDYHYTNLAANQVITVPVTQAGTYYILAYGSAVSVSPENYAITAALVPFGIQSVEPSKVGQGPATIEIDGSKFDNNTTFELLGPNSTVVPERTVQLQSSTTAFVQFNLAGMPAGPYSVEAIPAAGSTVTLSGALTVAAESTNGLQIYLSVPSGTLPGSQGSVTVSYVNKGNTDALAPLLELTATNALLKLADQTSFAGSAVQFLGISSTGPAGVIRPGQTGSVSIQYEATGATGSVINFQVQLADDSQTMDWAGQEAGLQLPTIPDTAWPGVFANFVADVASTVASYHAVLAADDSYLGQFGEATDDVDTLLSFEIEKADASYTGQSLVTVTEDSLPAPGMALTFQTTFLQSISGRYYQGLLGTGWTTNWDISMSTVADGDAVLSDSGSSLYYTLQPNGTYTDESVDHATLTRSNNAYNLVETDGTIYQFNPIGTLAYMQDADGNRIGASYNVAGQLATLTDSDGENLNLDYNAQGQLATLTDSSGMSETFGYSGQFLTTIASSFGTTTFSYVSGRSVQQDNALSEIAYQDGVHAYFAYDSNGRLTDQHLDGGAENEGYTYLTPGGYTETNGDGDTTTTFFNLYGATVETVNPLGDATYYRYDNSLNLIEVHGPEGRVYNFTYDADGNVISKTDPLGNNVIYTYNSANSLTSYTDADGNTTSYGYDGNNNLLSVTYANGDEEQSTYNPLGEATSFLDADGDAIDYTYNAQGLVTEEMFADDLSYSFTYNGQGDMLTATDSSGTITFAYGDASNPNLLTEVNYPNGTYLEFSYNAVGQRTQSVDQTGFKINYTYNSVGQLSELTDGSGNLIVQYTYDAAGILVQEDMGNGTRTVYTYDSDGDVLSITNYAPDHMTVNSYDDYTYDALGNVLTDTSQNGEWTYSYDADSELTAAVFISNNTSILPNENIQYVYDASGNRISETVNGVTTKYVSNDVNEYTSSTTDGVTTTYRYDANGNLVAEAVSGNTTTYMFNELNELMTVSGPSLVASYVYDPLGNMVSQTVNGARTNFEIDPVGLRNVVATNSSGTGPVTHYTYGLGLVSQVSSSGPAFYYNLNNIGSTVGMTGSSGTYVNQYAYLPFGQTITLVAGVANQFTFVGQLGVVNDVPGLLYMRARFYNVTTGQYLSADPSGLAGGDTNFRRYTANNPVGLVDPSGLCYTDVPGHIQNWWNGLNDFQKSQVIAGGLLIGLATFVPFAAGLWIGAAVADAAALEGLFAGIGYGLFKDAAKDVLNQLGFNQLLKQIWNDLNTPCPCQCPVPSPAPTPWKPGPSKPTPIKPPHDPNDIIGPAGYGDQNFVSANQVLPYQIDFENDPTAALPAQQVTVTQQLDPGLDWGDFRLGSFGFDGMTFTVPANSSFYQTTIDLSQTLGYDVQVAATIDELTGIATWTLTTVDPATGEIPTDPTIGFLPPDNAEGAGEGFVSYTIMANPGDTDGTIINAQATVVFYTQPPINTPQIFNTIGSASPTVTLGVSALNFTTNSFTLSWNGQDETSGPGIADFDVYVSTNGGAYTSYLADTTLTQSTFIGQAGDSDSFYVVAIDNIGTSSAPSATVNVLLVPPPTQPAPPTLLPADDSGTQGDGTTDDTSPSLIGTTQANATVELLDSANAVIATTTADSTGNFTFAVPGAPLSPGAYPFTVVASNVNGASPASNSFTLTIVAAPAVPSAPTLLSADDSGTQGDGTTDVTSPSLTGTAFSGALVQLLNSSNTVIASTTANGSGAYLFPLTSLALGTYNYSVQTTDQYGDVSSPSPTFSLTIVAAPTIPSAPTLLPADDSGTQGDNTTDDASPSLTSTTFAGATVNLLNSSDTVIATTTAGGTGAYGFALSSLAVGTYSYAVQTVDQYGDISGPSQAYSLTIVAAPTTPTAPALFPADDSGTQGDDTTDNASLSLTGTTFANATVQLLNSSNTVIGSATANGSGMYVIPLGTLALGTYAYSVQTVDPYGDVSSASAPFSLTIVSAPATPSAPTLLPADSNGSPDGETTYLKSPSFTGTTLAGATVELLNASGTVVTRTQANSSGVYQFQVGPLTVGSYSYSVDVVDQYGDVSSPSASQTINVANTPTHTPTTPPSPLVTVLSAQVETIKIRKGKKTVKETVLVVDFSAAINASAADNANAFELAPVIKVKASGKGENKKPATTKLGALVPVASASYMASNSSVTLLPRGKLTASKPEELIVNGSLLIDTSGREIDGNDDGQPGGDYIATISGKRVTAGGIPLVQTRARAATVADVVDRLLARGELAEIARSVRAEGEAVR